MRICASLFLVLVFALPSSVSAGITDCAEGYSFNPRSGVGCMQKDCTSVPHAFYDYTGHCVCYACGEVGCSGDKDYRKGCTRDASYAQCPWCLYLCISPDDRCPGEKPTQASCEGYCKSYHGTHYTARLDGDRCDCGCKEGYKPDRTLLCVPTKATCDRYCNEYHGTDKAHGGEAYGTPVGTMCDCHCKKGYVTDETLTCVKANTCQEECQKKMGDGAIGEGKPPDCSCKCKPGYAHVTKFIGGEWRDGCEKIHCPENSKFDEKLGKCVCDEGYLPEPLDGRCFKRLDEDTCGNNVCDVTPREGALIEDCGNCPKDCKCKAGTFCNPEHEKSTIEGYGCVEEVAILIDTGCADGVSFPHVMVSRSGNDREEVGYRGMRLSEGDEVRLTAFKESGKGMCQHPYVTIAWGNVKARMVLGSATVMQTVKIRKDAVASGWRSLAEEAKKEGWSLWYIVSNLFPQNTITILSFFTNPDSMGDSDQIKVYVKSELYVNMTMSGAVFYTLEGQPIIEVDGKNTTLTKGRKMEVRKGAAQTPKNFSAGELQPYVDTFESLPVCPPNQEPSGTGCKCQSGYVLGKDMQCAKDETSPLCCLPFLTAVTALSGAAIAKMHLGV